MLRVRLVGLVSFPGSHAGLWCKPYQPDPEQCQEIRLSKGGFTDKFGITFGADGLIDTVITSLDASSSGAVFCEPLFSHPFPVVA